MKNHLLKVLFILCSTLLTTAQQKNNYSDISIYPSQPYFQDGAGYNPSTEINNSVSVKFTSKQGGNDTKRINKAILKLSKKGGGKIIITKGNYSFKNVILKSNIHLEIEPNVIIKMDNTVKKGKKFIFNIGMLEGQKLVENIKITGLGNLNNRPTLVLEKPKNTFYRAIAIGYVKNLLIENIKIQDNLTKGAAIAFNPVKINQHKANIAQNVTITNVELTGGSIGYGLAQTNVGKNVLLKNLSCEGGMTCRIEAHTGRKYDLGVDNIVIKNVASVNGKAAVLLQPHSVVNGRVLVDGATSIGSTWTLFLKNGFVSKESKRRAKGTFAPTTTFKNISLQASDNTATLSYKNFKYVPKALHSYYKTPNFSPITNDANYSIKNNKLSTESAVKGASIAVIYIDTKYPINIPLNKDLKITGKTKGRLKIIDNRNK